MRKLIYFSGVAAVVALVAGPALAGEGFASAKTGARVADFVLINNQSITVGPDDSDNFDSNWQDIFHLQLKTSNGKYAYIEPSLECILVTETKVKNSNHGKDAADLESDTSAAISVVQVRVLVDGAPAYPVGELATAGNPLTGTGVTYCKREQELEALFGGIFTDCEDTNGDGHISVLDECQLTDEELRLLLNSTTATSFNFVYGPMDSDVHDVTVQSRIVLSADAGAGFARAEAGIGRGSVIVSEGRLSHDQGAVLCTSSSNC